MLFQDEKFVKGMVSFGIKTKGDVQMVIRVFEEEAVSTIMHEIENVFKRTLYDIDRAVYNCVLGDYPDGVASRAAARMLKKMGVKLTAKSNEVVELFHGDCIEPNFIMVGNTVSHLRPRV